MTDSDDGKRPDEIGRFVENAEAVASPSFDPADSRPQEDQAKQDPAEIVAAVEGAEILAFPSASAGGARPGGPPPPDDGGSGAANDGGGDDGDDGIVSQLNAEYALVLMGSRAVIMRETPDAPIEDRTRVLSIDAFKAYFSNRGSSVLRRERQADGTWIEARRYVKWAPRWPNLRGGGGIKT